jgi:hypothetical protein
MTKQTSNILIICKTPSGCKDIILEVSRYHVVEKLRKILFDQLLPLYFGYKKKFILMSNDIDMDLNNPSSYKILSDVICRQNQKKCTIWAYEEIPQAIAEGEEE